MADIYELLAVGKVFELLLLHGFLRWFIFRVRWWRLVVSRVVLSLRLCHQMVDWKSFSHLWRVGGSNTPVLDESLYCNDPTGKSYAVI